MRKRKLLAFAAALALLAAALPAWAAEEKFHQSTVSLDPSTGILYALYLPSSEPISISIPAGVLVEGQLIRHSLLSQGDDTETYEVEFKKLVPSPQGHLIRFTHLGKSETAWTYGAVIARVAGPAEIAYQIGGISRTIEVPEAAPGALRIRWPELQVITPLDYGIRYSFGGSLPVVKLRESRESTDGGRRIEFFRYWSSAEELLEGRITFSYTIPPLPPTKEGTFVMGTTFPFCPASLTSWLEKSPAYIATAPSGGAGNAPPSAWPLLPAAAGAVVLGWALPRRAVDVWLAAEADRILVRRGRRGFGRVRAVLTFIGESATTTRELVLARNESRVVEAPATWRVAELATPGRRNKAAPTRLEREIDQDADA